MLCRGCWRVCQAVLDRRRETIIAKTLFGPLLLHFLIDLVRNLVRELPSLVRVRRCQKICGSGRKKCLNPESNRGLARVKGVI